MEYALSPLKALNHYAYILLLYLLHDFDPCEYTVLSLEVRILWWTSRKCKKPADSGSSMETSQNSPTWRWTYALVEFKPIALD